jgi:hypothetical protein
MKTKLFMALLCLGAIIGAAQFGYITHGKVDTTGPCIIPEGCRVEDYYTGYNTYRGFPVKITDDDYQINPSRQRLLYLNGLFFVVCVPGAGLLGYALVHKLRKKA